MVPRNPNHPTKCTPIKQQLILLEFNIIPAAKFQLMVFHRISNLRSLAPKQTLTRLHTSMTTKQLRNKWTKFLSFCRHNEQNKLSFSCKIPLRANSSLVGKPFRRNIRPKRWNFQRTLDFHNSFNLFRVCTWTNFFAMVKEFRRTYWSNSHCKPLSYHWWVIQIENFHWLWIL